MIKIIIVQSRRSSKKMQMDRANQPAIISFVYRKTKQKQREGPFLIQIAPDHGVLMKLIGIFFLFFVRWAKVWSGLTWWGGRVEALCPSLSQSLGLTRGAELLGK